MRMLFSFKLAAALFVVAGIMLALSVFIPSFIEDDTSPERTIEIFASDKDPIVAFLEVDDAGHFIGEAFPIRIVVQHRINEITLSKESFLRAIFLPFERTDKDALVMSRQLPGDVVEYVYEVEVVTLTALPGKAYNLAPIVLDYVSLETGELKQLSVSLTHPLVIGSYYGETAGKVPLRPYKDSLDSPDVSKSWLLWVVSGSLFAAALILLVRWGGAFVGHYARSRRSHSDSSSEEQQLWDFIARFRDATCPDDRTSPRNALIQIGERAVYFAQCFNHVSGPQEFWNTQNDLTDFLRRAYSGPDVTQDDIIRAGNALEIFFGDDLVAPRGRLSGLFHAMRRIMSRTKRGDEES